MRNKAKGEAEGTGVLRDNVPTNRGLWLFVSLLVFLAWSLVDCDGPDAGWKKMDWPSLAEGTVVLIQGFASGSFESDLAIPQVLAVFLLAMMFVAAVSLAAGWLLHVMILYGIRALHMGRTGLGGQHSDTDTEAQ